MNDTELKELVELKDQEAALWTHFRDKEKDYEYARDRWHEVHVKVQKLEEQARVYKLVEERLQAMNVTTISTTAPISAGVGVLTKEALP
jgi:transcription elongation GreA/GreB family factor